MKMMMVCGTTSTGTIGRMGVIWIQLLLLPILQADLTKKVYCKNACEDYLRIEERLMRVCGENDLKALQCGSVITCESPAEGDIYNRPNGSTQFATNITCCYSITYTEQGDCDRINDDPHQQTTQRTDGMKLHQSGWECAAELLRRLWPLLGVLVVLLGLETTFVLWRVCRSLRGYGKGARLADSCNEEHNTTALSQSLEAGGARCAVSNDDASKHLIRHI